MRRLEVRIVRIDRRHAVKAVLVFTAVFVLLVGGTVLAGTLSSLMIPVDETGPPTYDTSELFIEKLEAEGEVDVSPTVPGVVVIDRAHGNAFENDDIRELTTALTRAGHEVRTVDDPANFETALADADALVVIEPTTAYSDETTQTVETFVANDGRLLLMGGPTRAVLVDMFLEEHTHEIDSLATNFGIAFGTDHVYDMEANDGNHRNVLVEGTDHPLVTEVDTAVVSIGTHVSGSNAEPLLVTQPSAQRADGGAQNEYAVAVATENVVAVGDTDFLGGSRFNVADNNVFIAALVEFLGGG